MRWLMGALVMALGLVAQAPPPPGGRPTDDGPDAKEKFGRPMGRFERRGGGEWMEAWIKMRAGGDGHEMAELRDRLNALSKLSDAEVLTQLEKWPPYQSMGLGEKGNLLQRIQEVRELRTKTARRKANALGLEIPAAEQEKFTAMFWDSKVEMDRRLAEEMEPRRRQYQQEMDAKIIGQFGQYRTNKPAAPSPAPPPSAPSAPLK